MIRDSVGVLVAEDDPDDRLMIKEAFDEYCVSNPVTFVHDGEELMDYLHRQGPYADLRDTPLPGIILLDLNMPKKDGHVALKEIKANEALQKIPVVVLTTSRSDEDIVRSYGLGVSSFITKPVTFDQLD